MGSMGFGSMKPGSQSTRTSSGLRVGSPNVPNQSGFGAGLVRPHPYLCTACSALIHGVTFAPPESRITTPIIQQKNHPRQCALILRLALAGTLKRQCVQITEAVGSRRRTLTNGNVRQWRVELRVSRPPRHGSARLQNRIRSAVSTPKHGSTQPSRTRHQRRMETLPGCVKARVLQSTTNAGLTRWRGGDHRGSCSTLIKLFQYLNQGMWLRPSRLFPVSDQEIPGRSNRHHVCTQLGSAQSHRRRLSVVNKNLGAVEVGERPENSPASSAQVCIPHKICAQPYLSNRGSIGLPAATLLWEKPKWKALAKILTRSQR